MLRLVQNQITGGAGCHQVAAHLLGKRKLRQPAVGLQLTVRYVGRGSAAVQSSSSSSSTPAHGIQPATIPHKPACALQGASWIVGIFHRASSFLVVSTTFNSVTMSLRFSTFSRANRIRPVRKSLSPNFEKPSSRQMAVLTNTRITKRLSVMRPERGSSWRIRAPAPGWRTAWDRNVPAWPGLQAYINCVMLIFLGHSTMQA